MASQQPIPQQSIPQRPASHRPTVDLVLYHPESVPGLFYLQNRGYLCYMNGIVQALLGLSSVNEEVIASLERYKAALAKARDHPHSADVAAACQRQIGLLGAYHQLATVPVVPTADIPTHSVQVLFETLLRKQEEDAHRAAEKRRATGKHDSAPTGSTLRNFRQEDAQELMILLLNNLGDDVKRHMEVRYECRLKCDACGKERNAGDGRWEEPELVVDMTDAEALSSQEDIQRYVWEHSMYPAYYKCDCGAENTTNTDGRVVTPHVKQTYKLKRANEVIILMFKKYLRKGIRQFPRQLRLWGVSGELVYETVGQIDHHGTQDSGHYVARTYRHKPRGYQESRDIILQGKLNTEIDPHAQNECRRKLNDWRKDRESAQAVFLTDDERISYVGEVEPTPDTYMVFYHLRKVEPRVAGATRSPVNSAVRQSPG
jgi:hypothetical protein